MYIFRNDEGFTDNSFISESYDNVHTILLTIPICKHIELDKYDDINIWNLEKTTNILFLNPKNEQSVIGEYYIKYEIYIFGDSTRKFLCFLQSQDIQFSEQWKKYKS